MLYSGIACDARHFNKIPSQSLVTIIVKFVIIISTYPKSGTPFSSSLQIYTLVC